MNDPEEIKMENPAETMRKVMAEIGLSEAIKIPDPDVVLTDAALITIPTGRKVEDLTSTLRKAAEYLKPARRRGTATLYDLDSLITWANRFKGETSALFAKPDMTSPSLTCIADYHAKGAPDAFTPEGDDTARHCHHRARYEFPLSDEWKAWMAVAGKPLEKDDLGEFIEANAKDIMDPTPAILKGEESEKNQNWENRLIATARQIEGRYGQLAQLLAMSRQFQVYETSDLTVTSNRDTGEASIQFLNEHKDAAGKPLNIPNLLIIAIPVFLGDKDRIRMTVRFRYRKMGGAVKFILTPYNPERVFKGAFDDALAIATEKTELPLMRGTPESGTAG